MITAPLPVRPINRSMPLTPEEERFFDFKKSLEDPCLFFERYLGVDLWKTQREILTAVTEYPRVAVKSCHASSKCVASSEYLALADGSRVKAGSLIGKEFYIPTLYEGQVVLARALASFNVFEEVFELTTESGRKIVRNTHHPLWAAYRAKSGNGVSGKPVTKDTIRRGDIVVKEWVPFSEIQIGDYVALTDSLPIFGKEEFKSEDELKILAYLIGDGGLTIDTHFTQQDNKQLAEFKLCAEHLNCKVKIASSSIEKWDGVSYRVVGKSEERIRVKSKTGSVPHRVNPITNLVRIFGLFGKRSEYKFIPEKVFRLSKKQISLFLSRLFSTDGFASTYLQQTATIGYSSTSEELIRGVESLLLRFGIHPYVCSGDSSYKNKEGLVISCLPSWTLAISSFDEVIRFCDEIGIYGKEEAVEKCRKIAEEHLKKSNNSKFGYGPSREWRKKNAPKGTFWDTVKSIKSKGIQATIAIEVPDHGTYLTAFYEHNTFSAARLVLWFLQRYQDEAVVVTTAPSWNQVKTVLWGEVHSALIKSKIAFPKANQVELHLGPKRLAYGLSTSVQKQDEGVKIHGIHAKNVLVIIDEAPGLDPKIWEAIESARAGGNVRVLALGNPTIASGPFHTAFIDDRIGWKTITIDAFNTPNFECVPGHLDLTDDKGEVIEGSKLWYLLKQLTEEEIKHDICPYLVTKSWVREKFYEWGPDHPSWQSRVRGQFPKQAPDALLSLAWLETQKNKEYKEKVTDETVAGVDVAGPGEDETSLTVRKGPKIVFHEQTADQDPRGWIMQRLIPFQGELKAVNIDCIGVGWNMYTHVKDVFKDKAFPVNVCNAANDSEKFADLKSEYYWGLRDRLKVGDFYGLTDEKTIGQLAGIRYQPTPRGQVKIESKADAKRRGVNSPDRAESVMLAFATNTKMYSVLSVMKEIGKDMQKTQASQLMKPVLTDKQLSCPQCSAVCVIPNNNGWRCNSCGNQWSEEKAKIPGFTRKDILMKFGGRNGYKS